MNDAPAAPRTPETPDTPDTPHAAPVLGDERVALIDAIRGFALLGILPMNIPYFAYASSVYFNPSSQGGFRGVNFLAWLVGHLVFDLKMMTIFSALFGAGIIIFTTRAAQRADHPGALFTRRISWLLVFGLIHAYLIWEGDILVAYAAAGAIAYFVRNRSPRWLFLVACAALLHTPAVNAFFSWSFNAAHDAYQALLAGEHIAPWRQELAGSYEGMIADLRHSADDFARERAAFTGGYFGLLPQRAVYAARWQFQYFPLMYFGRIFGVMLLGMAALRIGVFTGHRTNRFYIAMLAVGYLVGFPLTALGAREWLASGFDPVAYFTITNYNYFGSLFVAAGHIALVALVVKSGALARLTSRLAAVGQMAFTNYIAHSIICSLLFYGYGFGLWGRIDRAGLWGIVALIWAAQLLWSPWWLARFRFGPLEWLWRSLTYWKKQPMRRAPAA